jgi:hypothetical protein
MTDIISSHESENDEDIGSSNQIKHPQSLTLSVAPAIPSPIT